MNVRQSRTSRGPLVQIESNLTACWCGGDDDGGGVGACVYWGMGVGFEVELLRG